MSLRISQKQTANNFSRLQMSSERENINLCDLWYPKKSIQGTKIPRDAQLKSIDALGGNKQRQVSVSVNPMQSLDLMECNAYAMNPENCPKTSQTQNFCIFTFFKKGGYYLKIPTKFDFKGQKSPERHGESCQEQGSSQWE